jgi:hypothetical protein
MPSLPQPDTWREYSTSRSSALYTGGVRAGPQYKFPDHDKRKQPETVTDWAQAYLLQQQQLLQLAVIFLSSSRKVLSQAPKSKSDPDDVYDGHDRLPGLRIFRRSDALPRVKYVYKIISMMR